MIYEHEDERGAKNGRVIVGRAAFGQQRRDAIELMMKMKMMVMVMVRC